MEDHAVTPRTRAGGATALAIAAGVAGSAAAVAITWARVLRASARSIDERPAHADALVVLGAYAAPTGPGRELAARLDHAIYLHRVGVAPTIIVSGGIVRTTDEIDVMRAYLVEHGVPNRDILDGRPGNNTRETIATTARIAQQMHWTHVVAVSSAFHAHRLEVEGKRARLQVTAACSGAGPDMLGTRSRRARLGTEVVACLYYALPRWIPRLVHPHIVPLRHAAANLAAGFSERDAINSSLHSHIDAHAP